MIYYVCMQFIYIYIYMRVFVCGYAYIIFIFIIIYVYIYICASIKVYTSVIDHGYVQNGQISIFHDDLADLPVANRGLP